MKKHILIVLFCLFFYPLSAQKIAFCTYYDAHGKPEYHSNQWDIDPVEGSYIYLVFSQTKNLPKPKMYVFIDKFHEGRYQEYDNQKIFITQDKNWVAAKYTFRHTGKYKITFLDAEKQELASEIIEINLRNKIFFSEGIDAKSNPIKYGNVFRYNTNNHFYIFIKDVKPFGSSSIFVKIFSHDGIGYNTLKINDEYFIDPNATYIFFKRPFLAKGDYKALVYDKENNLIDTGYFKITN